MRLPRLVLALTAVNVLLVISTWNRSLRASEEAAPALVRARSLELVDDRGVVRSRFNVEPGGEVVLRLIDRNGTIRVKLGAGEGGSGLLLLDETTEPAVQLIARRKATKETPNTTRIALNGATGQKIVTP
ncbi:MAG TPA: hypothetical protein VFP58_10300 [Candidatus Eisenbacteria bacterium]|nr:hypothetical protein [Candidatus Eisenbacteria bacterium]